MAILVKFDAVSTNPPEVFRDYDAHDAHAEIGSWVTAGFDVSVYYEMSRECDEYGPKAETIVTAHHSTLNNRPGFLYGAVWMDEAE